MRRTWAEIDLDALAHNYQQARQKIGPGVKYLGVVKADAYGHGAVQIARKLEQLGADYLAVSSLDEARELRHGGITMPILILGHTPPEMVPQLIALPHHPGRVRPGQGGGVQRRGRRSAAARCGSISRWIPACPGWAFWCGASILSGGVERHCGVLRPAGAGGGGHLHPLRRLRHGRRGVARPIRGSSSACLPACWTRWRPGAARFAIRHCANSGALTRYPEMYLDMVRPGIALVRRGGRRRSGWACGR